ncbi:hypothetical protein P152DRAFT_517457 [Eremomyces bilateralis CBS 781.70]|uniref:CFEM domain-containing protein n=1 Tax=Eremomyces bilateralis CBS 781.70 TaxID=1392243 RepID=A0A6G1FSA2_9PEZI|nr:uncharacterized protein P152DRAFT_517457 [Eremomyces bilateralis CBS 781.70]KAF1808559.1 hypothetical protein P152DRAFT_517457 [Eremomyces bilateralis CBS 781.70]
MKYSIALIAAVSSLAAAQASGGESGPAGHWDYSALSECGQTCIRNMLQLAPTLGCDEGDHNCYCCNANFGYGIRDCANEACDNEDAVKVLQWGAAACGNSVGANGCPPDSTPARSIIAGATQGGGDAIPSESSAPDATPTSDVSESASSVASDASESASGIGESASSEASDVSSSAFGDASSAPSSSQTSAPSSRTSPAPTSPADDEAVAAPTNAAPFKTAAPVLGAGAMAALLLL